MSRKVGADPVRNELHADAAPPVPARAAGEREGREGDSCRECAAWRMTMETTKKTEAEAKLDAVCGRRRRQLAELCGAVSTIAHVMCFINNQKIDQWINMLIFL